MDYSLLTFNDFSYKDYIRNLTEEEFKAAKQTVLAMWSGVLELWAVLPEEVRYAKRSAVLNLLIAWYLVDMYPTRVMGGIQASGGMALSGKSIRDVSLSYSAGTLPSDYESLQTNQFGVKAAHLIHYAPEMMGVYGGGAKTFY